MFLIVRWSKYTTYTNCYAIFLSFSLNESNSFDISSFRLIIDKKIEDTVIKMQSKMETLFTRNESLKQTDLNWEKSRELVVTPTKEH